MLFKTSAPWPSTVVSVPSFIYVSGSETLSLSKDYILILVLFVLLFDFVLSSLFEQAVTVTHNDSADSMATSFLFIKKPP